MGSIAQSYALTSNAITRRRRQKADAEIDRRRTRLFEQEGKRVQQAHEQAQAELKKLQFSAKAGLAMEAWGRDVENNMREDIGISGEEAQRRALNKNLPAMNDLMKGEYAMNIIRQHPEFADAQGVEIIQNAEKPGSFSVIAKQRGINGLVGSSSVVTSMTGTELMDTLGNTFAPHVDENVMNLARRKEDAQNALILAGGDPRKIQAMMQQRGAGQPSLSNAVPPPVAPTPTPATTPAARAPVSDSPTAITTDGGSIVPQAPTPRYMEDATPIVSGTSTDVVDVGSIRKRLDEQIPTAHKERVLKNFDEKAQNLDSVIGINKFSKKFAKYLGPEDRQALDDLQSQTAADEYEVLKSEAEKLPAGSNAYLLRRMKQLKKIAGNKSPSIEVNEEATAAAQAPVSDKQRADIRAKIRETAKADPEFRAAVRSSRPSSKQRQKMLETYLTYNPGDVQGAAALLAPKKGSFGQPKIVKADGKVYAISFDDNGNQSKVLIGNETTSAMTPAEQSQHYDNMREALKVAASSTYKRYVTDRKLLGDNSAIAALSRVTGLSQDYLTDEDNREASIQHITDSAIYAARKNEDRMRSPDMYGAGVDEMSPSQLSKFFEDYLNYQTTNDTNIDRFWFDFRPDRTAINTAQGRYDPQQRTISIDTGGGAVQTLNVEQAKQILEDRGVPTNVPDGPLSPEDAERIIQGLEKEIRKETAAQ